MNPSVPRMEVATPLPASGPPSILIVDGECSPFRETRPTGGARMVADGIQDQKAYAQVIAKAWADEEFKSRLLAEPAKVLREQGIAVPEGVEVRIVENTDKLVHFALPAPPSDELSEEQVELAGFVGGRPKASSN